MAMEGDLILREVKISERYLYILFPGDFDFYVEVKDTFKDRSNIHEFKTFEEASSFIDSRIERAKSLER